MLRLYVPRVLLLCSRVVWDPLGLVVIGVWLVKRPKALCTQVHWFGEGYVWVQVFLCWLIVRIKSFCDRNRKVRWIRAS